MSRHKSQVTLERDRDREIRRKRRALKRQDKERRAAELLERRARRENVRNAGPIVVRQDPEYFGYHLVRDYHPLMFCERCREMKRANWMKTETICIGCFEGGQSDEREKLAEGGASSAPGQEEKEKAQPQGQAGQPQLQLGF